MTTASDIERARLHRSVRRDIQYVTHNIDKLRSFVTQGIARFEMMVPLQKELEDPNYSFPESHFKSLKASIDRAFILKRRLWMVLEAYLDSFTPFLIDWSNIRKDKWATLTISPLSFFRSLQKAEEKDDASLKSIFGTGRSNKITKVLKEFALRCDFTCCDVQKYLMSDTIRSCMVQVMMTDEMMMWMYQKILEVVCASDMMRRGSIVHNVRPVEMYYRYWGTKGTKTELMKLEEQIEVLPDDQVGWASLMEAYRGQIPDQGLRAYNQKAEEAYFRARDQFLNQFRPNSSEEDSDEDSDDMDEDNSVADITDEVMAKRALEYQQKKNDAELIE